MIAAIKNNIDEIGRLCKKHHVMVLYIFGSALNESFNDKSDLDFLYEFDTKGIDFDNLPDADYDYADNFFELKFSLEKLLKRQIDLIEKRSFKNPYFNESVEKTKQLIYADKRFEETVV